MFLKLLISFLFVVVLAIGNFPVAQTGRSGRASSSTNRTCAIGGSYRIDVEGSDRLYSAVRGATGSVPFQDQQQFFLDLSVRLTPPDLLAIQCDGSRVSVASSRATKMTFVADGRMRQERLPDGTIVRSRISMSPDVLIFTSSGKAEDNLNVVFRALDGGQKLEVTRRIDAVQLAQPIVIRSTYNKLSDDVDWDVYNGRLVAGQRNNDTQSPTKPMRSVPASDELGAGRTADLRRALDSWIDATNRRDIESQMTFYMPRITAFYLSRNTDRAAVRAEKNRAFVTARSIDIRADEPETILQDNGRTAIMRFRKSYRIVDRSRTRSGVVIQELRWTRTGNGWRIFSERDVRVIR